jgi:hypothetical protein
MKLHRITHDLRTGEVTVQEHEVDTLDPQALYEQSIRDCPQCQAAVARGEPPQILDLPLLPDRSVLRRRPRWRHLKRFVR